LTSDKNAYFLTKQWVQTYLIRVLFIYS
jgi:hypothetical protein